MAQLATTLTQSDQSLPPLVLIHGLGSASTIFKSIIPALSQSFRVITVDLPGHGKSSFKNGQPMDPRSLGDSIFENIQAQFGLQSFHVAGNSLGGWIALEMAAAQPNRILSLTGLAPAGLWLKPAIERHPNEARSYYLAQTLRPFAKFGLRIKLFRKIGFESVSPKWAELSYETCFDAAQAVIHSPGYFPAWDGMLGKRFDALIPESLPVTILFGDSDNTLPPSHSQERSLAPAHSTWIEIKQCGHAPMWDHPDLIVKTIKQFIE